MKVDGFFHKFKLSVFSRFVDVMGYCRLRIYIDGSVVRTENVFTKTLKCNGPIIEPWCIRVLILVQMLTTSRILVRCVSSVINHWQHRLFIVLYLHYLFSSRIYQLKTIRSCSRHENNNSHEIDHANSWFVICLDVVSWLVHWQDFTCVPRLIH